MFDPSPYQPIMPFFDLTMGGLSRIYDPPNVPIQFELHYSIKQMNSVKFTLFDEAGWEVEPYIWQSRDPKTGLPGGSFKYGYKGKANIESPEQTFQLLNYTPVYQDGGFAINIFGLPSVQACMSSNQFAGTVKEYLQQFCDTHDLEMKIDPEFGIEHMKELGTNDEDTTEERELIVRKLAYEPDWRSIQRVLYYCRDGEGKGGYRAYITSEGGGKPILNIKRPPDSGADYSYTVEERSSVVIKWNPIVNFFSGFNAFDTHMNTKQALTGYPIKIALNHAVTKDFLTTFGYDVSPLVRSAPDKEDPDQMVNICPELFGENLVKGAVRNRTSGAISSFGGGVNPALVAHMNDAMGQNTAELTVFCDPRIEVNKLVDVTFYYPKFGYLAKGSGQQKHYTSGLYLITDVIHTVGPGIAETKMLLERTAHRTEPQKQDSSQ